MKLTIKEENFCLKYVETGNATEAYKHAYNASRMKGSTINEKASLMLAKDKTKARIKELRKPVIEKAQITLEQHLADLKRLRDSAEAAASYSAAITAEVSRGKACGLYIEKHEQVNEPVKIVINRPK